jgi:hypothetical protein
MNRYSKKIKFMTIDRPITQQQGPPIGGSNFIFAKQSPEGVLYADVGVLCYDSTTGNLFRKTTDNTVATGWVGTTLGVLAVSTVASVTTGFTAGAGATVSSASTYTGGTGSTAYTVGALVNILKTLGIIAA